MVQLVQSQLFVYVDEIFVQNRKSMFFDLLDDLSIYNSSSIHHNFKLKSWQIALFSAQVFKESKNEVAHEVETQNVVQLFPQSFIVFVQQERIDAQFEHIQKGVHVWSGGEIESSAYVSPWWFDSTSHTPLIQAAIPKLLILAKLLLSSTVDFSFWPVILGFPP